MSIWFDGVIHLDHRHVNESKNPRQGILDVLKKHGMNVGAPGSEMSLKGIDKLNYNLLICNPDGYTDELHTAFKELVKYPYILGVTINKHYYF